MMPKEVLCQALPALVSKSAGFRASPLDSGHLFEAILHILRILVWDDFIDASDASVPFEGGF